MDWLLDKIVGVAYALRPRTRKIIGWSIIGAFLLAIFGYGVVDIGFLQTLAVFVGIAVVIVLFIIAVVFIDGDL